MAVGMQEREAILQKKRKRLPHAVRIDRSDGFKIQPYRWWIQTGFLILTLWIGAQFILFVYQLEHGLPLTVNRPPGVEAFLPLSALISLKYWVLTGVLNRIHPASVVLLLIFLGMGLFLKKAFCSWVCPIGWLSERLANLHRRVFDRYRFLPRWVDYPLRSLKYLLLAFFLWAILVQMDIPQLHHFIYSPYNRVADIKMLKFFTEMSSTTFWTLAILVGLSLLIPHFWCRYLCPYGALLGVLSWFSPLKIHRNIPTCIDCEKCTRVCPANIPVHRLKTVLSDECHACLQCVDACPVKDTLYLSVTTKRAKINRKVFAFSVVGLFLLGTLIARLTGYWHNKISEEEYRFHIQHLNTPVYHHSQGNVPEYTKMPNWYYDDITP